MKPIIKNKNRHPAEDYAYLREQGLKYIEKLSGNLWTDYNSHDPGITILEVLCYALTDLGYRAGFAMEQILAEQPETDTPLFTARDILTCAPVTIDDFRVLCMDIVGIKNAWLEETLPDQPTIWRNEEEGWLSLMSFALSFDINVDSTPIKTTIQLPLWDETFNNDEITASDFASISFSQPVPIPHTKDYHCAVIISITPAKNIVKPISISTSQPSSGQITKKLWSKLNQKTPGSIIEQYRTHLKNSASGEPKKLYSLAPAGLYKVTLELETIPRVGDPNLGYIKKQIQVANEDHTLTVLVPLWDQLWKQGIKSEDLSVDCLTFSTLESTPKSLNYTAQMHLALPSSQRVSFPVTLLATSAKSASAFTIIQNTLNQTDSMSMSRTLSLRYIQGLKMAQKVLVRLNKNRPLCEDFHSICAAQMEQIGVCADIHLEKNADVNHVEAQLQNRLTLWCSPNVRFYSLEEMNQKNENTEDIFQGPILDHGFIDRKELISSNFKKEIHVSDVINLIMAIEGVASISSITMNAYQDDIPTHQGAQWCLPLSGDRPIRFSRTHSIINYSKEKIGLKPDDKKVAIERVSLNAGKKQGRMATGIYDRPVPSGSPRNIGDYVSIQEEFPLVYGVGHSGLPDNMPDQRIAQAKQLKAYLCVFDKLLAQFLQQIRHTSDLFSINPDLNCTYFSAIPELDAPHAAPLIKPFMDKYIQDNNSLSDKQALARAWKIYQKETTADYKATQLQRDDLWEDAATFTDRRNRSLDHLLARFSEDFADYALLIYSLEGKSAGQMLIEDKINFLKDYPQSSSRRGTGFIAPSYGKIWNTDNVSGIQHRVCRRLGIKDARRRSLAFCSHLENFDVYPENDDAPVDELRFRLPGSDNKVLLSSTRHFDTETGVEKTVEKTILYGSQKSNYAFKKGKNQKWYFKILDENGKLVARKIKAFDTMEMAQKEADFIADHLLGIDESCEGFHLVEHILLRPESLFDIPLPIYMENEEDLCPGTIDPYSFRCTAVVPAWLRRFSQMPFRQFFEKTLRQEAPAHIHLKICWVDQNAMHAFETAYQAWLVACRDGLSSQKERSLRRNKLIQVMAGLNSVYPPITLHECSDHTSQNPVLLGTARLGSMKRNEK